MATKRRSMAVSFGALIEWQRQAFAALGERRTTPSFPALLLAIAVKDGGSVSELAELLGTDIKTASRLLKEIRARGWATVEQDTKDERARRVMLTALGKDITKVLHDAVVAMAFRVVEKVVGPLSTATFGAPDATGTKRRRTLRKYSKKFD